GFGRGGAGACPRLRPKGQRGRLVAACELPGCRWGLHHPRQPFPLSLEMGGAMALGALFDNFRILNDGVKAILIVMPFATVLGLTALLLHYRLKRAQLALPSEKEPQPPRDRKEAGIHAL